MSSDTTVQLLAIADQLRALCTDKRELLIKAVDEIEPFNLQRVMAMAVEAGMRVVDEGTGCFRAEHTCRHDIVVTFYAVTVWADGTLEGVREITLNGQERKVVTSGVELHIHGTGVDHTVFSAKCGTAQQALSVIEAIRRQGDGKGNAGLRTKISAIPA